MNVCEEYSVAKQLMLDIKKLKDKLVEYSVKYCMNALARKSGRGTPRKNVKTGKDVMVMK